MPDPSAAPGRTGSAGQRPRLDVGGAITVTAALMVAVYAIVNGNADGLDVGPTLILLAVAVVAVRRLPRRSRRACSHRSMPLGLFRRRNLSTANVAGILWAGAMFAWFFLSALYLQLVLGYSPLRWGSASCRRTS